jgi:hypothetical protein
MAESITFSIGQAVAWRPSPTGIAQVDSFGRRRVRIVYPAHNGRLRFASVPAHLLRGGQILIPLVNPFNRGVLPRAKTFPLSTKAHE